MPRTLINLEQVRHCDKGSREWDTHLITFSMKHVEIKYWIKNAKDVLLILDLDLFEGRAYYIAYLQHEMIICS